MPEPLDVLEERVAMVTDGISRMRSEIARLERALAARPEAAGGDRPAGTLAEENRRLLGERARVLERIRGLIAEIDRAL